MKQFTLKTRIMLSNFLRNGFTYRELKARIGFAMSSISVDMNNNGGKATYDGYEAESESCIRKKFRCKRKKLDISPGLKKYVIEQLRKDLSPEQISGIGYGL